MENRLERTVLFLFYLLILLLSTSVFSPPVSATLLEKLEIEESEFTHVSVWDVGEVNALKGIKRMY